MNGALTMVVAIVGMVAAGVVAWNLVQRQEAGDADLEKKLKADDERAAAGRRAEAQSREATDRARQERERRDPDDTTTDEQIDRVVDRSSESVGGNDAGGTGGSSY
jgi:uncharacterized protein HemX